MQKLPLQTFQKKIHRIDLSNIFPLTRKRASHGADIEAVTFVPITIGIEEKNSALEAYDAMGQIKRYLREYDVVFVKVPLSSDDNMIEDLIYEMSALNVGVMFSLNSRNHDEVIVVKKPKFTLIKGGRAENILRDVNPNLLDLRETLYKLFEPENPKKR